MKMTDADIENEAIIVRDLKETLRLALAMLFPYEPPDSRAVSDEFVAMAAVLSGDMSENVMGVIQRANARLNACDMCGEPRDGRDHSGCDAQPF